MRLKKLILQGFKSFADRTEFLFDAPIVGIVGPNGCGKSNVVDGFKWVLGEQSAKSLRGDAMMDVIFNGSGGRKPAGMAEVTLVFENPERADGSRVLNLDADEVAVGRRLFRDGTSEYQVNNSSSRLKDIRELFLDTGVGVDAYSVIEQGRVSALLEANPDERRLIFEEAAGISKYKVKKKEAQRKLEKVDQNLLRVTDIVDEVEKRLRGVKIQAGRARTFQEHTVRLNELRVTYALQEYHTLHTKLTELEANREDAQFQLDDVSADLQRKQNELGTKREELETLSRKKQQAEYELVQARASVQAAVQRQQYAKQQIEQIAEQAQQLESDRTDAETRLNQTRETLTAERVTLEQLTGELESHRKNIEGLQAAFRDGQLQQNQQANTIERDKAAILDLMRKLSQISNRTSAIDIERKNIANQQQRLAERRRVVLAEVESIEAQRVELQEQLDNVLAQILKQQEEMAVRRNEAASLGKQIATITEQLGAAKEHRSGLLSRQTVLKDLEARREGVSEGVKAVLRKRTEQFSFIRGLVADAMRVDVEHARVVEAALDGRDQWLVAPSAAVAMEQKAALEELEGRVNVIFLDELSRSTGVSPMSSEDSYDWNRHPQLVRLAVDLVRVEPVDLPLAQRLLGKTVVVDTLDDAVALRAAGPAGWRFVTANGEVVEPDGTLRAGPLTAAMGILSRRSELDAIAGQIAEVDARIARLTGQLSEGNEQAKKIEEEVNAIRNATYQSNSTKVELSSKISSAGDKINALKRETPVLDKELANFLEQTSRLADEEARLVQNRDQFEADQARRQKEVEELTARQITLVEEIKANGEALTVARVSLGQVQEKQLASRQQVDRHAALEAELVQQIERLVRSAKSLESKASALDQELREAEYAERQIEAKQAELVAQAEELTAKVSSLHEWVTALGREVESIREAHAETEEALHNLQMQAGEVRVRLETLVTRTMDDFQMDLPAKYAEFGDGEAGGGYTPAEMDWDAVAAEIKELKEKIHRLGNVNLDAIGEMDELEQRQQFLSAQVTDLTTSKKQLEELIDEINRESGVRFEQTFNAVREHFQGLFRKLFGGGKADIYLETELEEKPAKGALAEDGGPALPVMRKIDVLDAGIEIIARPPGKQPVSISQLSGGEKTMTCVALLMSIFKSKPSPFCILDEVDAALDEANNQRFNLIVQEFLEQSQFIVITHSKRTMQIADVLYGVTMQEQGVSKRVAVKFDQVDSTGRISDDAVASADEEEAVEAMA